MFWVVNLPICTEGLVVVRRTYRWAGRQAAHLCRSIREEERDLPSEPFSVPRPWCCAGRCLLAQWYICVSTARASSPRASTTCPPEQKRWHGCRGNQTNGKRECERGESGTERPRAKRRGGAPGERECVNVYAVTNAPVLTYRWSGWLCHVWLWFEVEPHQNLETILAGFGCFTQHHQTQATVHPAGSK